MVAKKKYCLAAGSVPHKSDNILNCQYTRFTITRWKNQFQLRNGLRCVAVGTTYRVPREVQPHNICGW